MTDRAKAVLEAALALPEAEREELAERLLCSLDDAEAASLSPEWKAEIGRRVKEIDDGTAELIEGEEVMRWLRSKAKGPEQP